MMEGAVRGTKFANSPSGWVNSDAFIQWFLKHFRPQISKRPLVLLYDGHLQFVSVRVLERAREDGVLLFPLPPHPAYNHCVENTCFLAFQMYFEKRLERFFQRSPNQALSKLNVAPILTHAYERALQPQNMISLFAQLGVCPFNNLATSIGAYLNIPDDYDQDEMLLQHDENGDQEQTSSGSGSSAHWGSSTSTASFSLQAALGIEPSNSGFGHPGS
uniref:DDE-1 domain-containing protein n=1 Tax=Mesocestoides corti TaxID=53468 RepID=A0A5K3G0H3_MESCO